MIRTIEYRSDSQSPWSEGVLHGFNNNHAIIEDSKTGGLLLTELKPESHVPNVRFKVLAEDWAKLQLDARRAAMRETMPRPNVGVRSPLSPKPANQTEVAQNQQ